MKLEVLLSTIDVKTKDLDNMNITCKCTVINKGIKEGLVKHKNFNIYTYNESGVSKSKNRGLSKISEDIILLSDDDVVYSDTFEKDILNEFKNNDKADVIFFNVESPKRGKRELTKRKRMHIWNSLNYATYNIAFRRKSIKGITFNEMFGPGAKYNNGTDTMFIKDIYENKLKVYSSPIYIGKVNQGESTWFKGYNEKYFYNKGALFTAINKQMRHILMLQYLIRHKEVLTDYKLFDAYKIMLKGSKEYLNDIRNS